jgi:hypothetical protein
LAARNRTRTSVGVRRPQTTCRETACGASEEVEALKGPLSLLAQDEEPRGGGSEAGGGGGLWPGRVALTVLTHAARPRALRGDRGGHRAGDVQEPARGAGLVPSAFPRLADPRSWRQRPQERRRQSLTKDARAPSCAAAWLRGDARGCDGGIREELAARSARGT